LSKRVALPPIQQAVQQYLSEGHTYGEICIVLGWMKPEQNRDKKRKPIPDTGRLLRCLGMHDMYSSTTRSNGTGYKYKYRNKRLSYQNAVRIVRAIERDPVEFDL
jgi:hypothetical protein